MAQWDLVLNKHKFFQENFNSAIKYFDFLMNIKKDNLLKTSKAARPCIWQVLQPRPPRRGNTPAVVLRTVEPVTGINVVTAS